MRRVAIIEAADVVDASRSIDTQRSNIVDVKLEVAQSRKRGCLRLSWERLDLSTQSAWWQILCGLWVAYAVEDTLERRWYLLLVM